MAAPGHKATLGKASVKQDREKGRKLCIYRNYGVLYSVSSDDKLTRGVYVYIDRCLNFQYYHFSVLICGFL